MRPQTGYATSAKPESPQLPHGEGWTNNNTTKVKFSSRPWWGRAQRFGKQTSLCWSDHGIQNTWVISSTFTERFKHQNCNARLAMYPISELVLCDVFSCLRYIILRPVSWAKWLVTHVSLTKQALHWTSHMMKDPSYRADLRWWCWSRDSVIKTRRLHWCSCCCITGIHTADINFIATLRAALRSTNDIPFT